MRLVPCIVLGAALAGAVAMSCTLPNIDDYVTPDAGAPAVADAGRDAAGDASSDVPTGEGGVANEGGVTSEAGTDSGATGCSVEYCMSFPDGSKPEDFANDGVPTTLGGSVAVESGALVAKVPAHTSGDEIVAQASRIISTTSKSAIIELDMRIDESDWGSFDGSASIFAVEFIGEGGSSFADIQVYIGRDFTDVTPYLNDKSFTPVRAAASFPRGRSVHFRFEANLDPTSGSFKMFYDGTPVLTQTGIKFGVGPKGSLRLDLGVEANNVPTPSFKITCDNVTVDIQ